MSRGLSRVVAGGKDDRVCQRPADCSSQLCRGLLQHGTHYPFKWVLNLESIWPPHRETAAPGILLQECFVLGICLCKNR